jgi:hypothetical protein
MRVSSRLKVVLLASSAVALLSFGCVTGSGGSLGTGAAGGQQGTLVERSKAQAPAWTALAPGKIHESEDVVNAEGGTQPGGLRYVEARGRLLNLPLGLKQTQLWALEASRTALAVDAKSRLAALGERSGTHVDGSSPEIDRRIGLVVAQVHEKYARVADIYFEKYVDDALPSDAAGAEFYAAWILIQIPRDGLSEMMLQLGRSLSQSTDPGVKRLGEVQSAEAH